MVTREQIEITLKDGNKDPFKTTGIDHDVKAITLLRERIPYQECRSIINSALHDKLGLCDVDKAIPHLTEEDLVVLADCNCFIDEDDHISLFV